MAGRPCDDTIVSVLGTGVPRLACLRRGSRGAQLGPSSSTQAQDPREGPSLARRTTQDLLRSGLSRSAREGRRDQGGVPHEVPVTQAMTTKARRAPAYVEALFPLWCKGGKRRQRYQGKETISVQQDQDQLNGRMEVIMEPKPASPSESLAGEDRL